MVHLAADENIQRTMYAHVPYDCITVVLLPSCVLRYVPSS